jgi:flagellar motor protein MotB
LIARGVKSSTIVWAAGRGESEPARPTMDDETEPANRRVEIDLQ